MSESPSSWQGQIQALEAKVTELTERNRKLANQLVGYGDRMQATISGIVKEAKVEALREAADEYRQPVLKAGTAPDMVRDWLRARADNLEASDASNP